MNTVASACPNPAIAINAEAVEQAGSAFGEDVVFAKLRTIGAHIETADMFWAVHFVGDASVGDVEMFFVR